MNQLIEEKFLEALQLCQNLAEVTQKPSSFTCEALKLFTQVDLLSLVGLAKKSVKNYARSVDNWQVEGCPFGVKDHCNILYFLLNIKSQNFEFFRSKNRTPEVICLSTLIHRQTTHF
jgi:hypothetical protein